MGSNLEKYAAEIQSAEEAVAGAMKSYRQGGSVTKVNKANDRLAEAWNNYRNCSGGIAPTK